MEYAKTIEKMSLDGGAACLDFVNSFVDHNDGVPVERIHSYDDLLTLTNRLRLLDRTTIKILRLTATRNKLAANRLLLKAKQSRLILSKVFNAVANRQLSHLDPNTLQQFNMLLSKASTKNVFKVAGKQLVEDWKQDVDLELPLTGFLLSAHELLQQEHQEYIKKCDGCAWLFIDTSKSHRRKWCDMQTCGSSVKSKRYYNKKKKN